MTDEQGFDPVFKLRSRYWQTVEDGKDVLHVESWVAPGGGVGPHVHPAMEEHFEVLEGRPEFLAGRKWTPYEPGTTAVVPPHTRHAFRNRTDEVVHFVAHVTPPSTLQAFLERADELARDGAINRFGLPRGLDGLLRAAELADDHRDMCTIGAPLPPRPIQRLIFPPLARASRRRRRSV